MRELNNDHLMKFYEIHETLHSIYMVVEYLSGGELIKKLSQKRKYNEKYVKKIIWNIISGLNYMHERNIMHRDLKPENLILKTKKNKQDVKLIDFGLADYINNKASLFRRCGTPGFVAPEIISLKPEETYNEKCDIFSSGVIFYIL